MNKKTMKYISIVFEAILKHFKSNKKNFSTKNYENTNFQLRDIKIGDELKYFRTPEN